MNPQVGSVDDARGLSASVNVRQLRFGTHSSAARGSRPPTGIPITRSTPSCGPASSGAKASRPELGLVLQLLRDGDSLKITRLDRLSRSVLHLVTLGAELRARGIGLHVSSRASAPRRWKAGRCSGCQACWPSRSANWSCPTRNDGPASARARGRVGARRARLASGQAALARKLDDEREKPVQQIADTFNVPRSTVYGHVNPETTVPRQPKTTAAKIKS